MYKIAVCLEHRFYEFEGKLYTKLAFPYDYWKDYLSFFEEVTVVARVKKVNEFTADMVRVDGDCVKYEALPYYHGPKQFLIAFFPLVLKIFKVSLTYKHFLLRSGNSTNILWLFLMLLRKPYIREYPGNIKEGMIGLVGKKLWVRILAHCLDSLAKIQAKFSQANSFVSQYCMELYGSQKPSFVFSSFKASEIDVNKENYNISNKFKIVCLGRLEGEKGHALLLNAISQNENKNSIEIQLIGDGSQTENLKKISKDNELNCIFLGAITDRQYIFNTMANADIFIIPSLTEGMPRALLEAMAIGLPCIGANVGGIPEAIEESYLYHPHDLDALNQLIHKFYDSNQLREQVGLRNKAFISNHFSDSALQEKKHAFWNSVYE